jgi:copper(I)-binding protein
MSSSEQNSLREEPADMTRLPALLVALILALGTALPLAAHEEKKGDITLQHPWSRPAPKGQNGVIYVRILNAGTTDDRLLSAHTRVAKKVELHRSTMEDGIHRMEKVDVLTVPAGGEAVLEPGGLHLMLIGLETMLMAEEALPVTFTFEQAGDITTTFSVEGRSGGDADDAHSGHGGAEMDDDGHGDH